MGQAKAIKLQYGPWHRALSPGGPEVDGQKVRISEGKSLALARSQEN